MTDLSTLTARQAFGLLARETREKGGSYVYRPDQVYTTMGGMLAREETCDYVEWQGDTLVGSCGVGCALVSNGVDPEDLEFVTISALLLDDHLPVKISTPALYVFQEFQTAQDQGYTWLVALRRARDYILESERS